MKILLVSDVESSYIWDYFDASKFKDIDLILSAGDLKSSYLSFLVTMVNKPLFYIHGNHDDNYIKCPPEGCECIDYKIIDFNGIRIMGLPGSKRYNAGNFQYTDKEMEHNIKKMWTQFFKYKGIDILLTHAGGLNLGDATDPCHEGFKCINTLIDKYKPKYFVHGHTHLTYSRKGRIIEYGPTTVINAYEKHTLEY